MPKRKRKKYSYDERMKYHRTKAISFTNKFRESGGFFGSQLNFDKYISAFNKNKSIQYSTGYSDYECVTMSDEDLKKQSVSYQRGWNSAKKADKKSRSIKF